MKLKIYYKGGKVSFDNVAYLPVNKLFYDSESDVMIRIDFTKMSAQIMMDDVDITYNNVKIKME